MSTQLSEITFIICLLFQIVKGQNCARVRNRNGLPEFQSHRYADRITRHHQVIIPSCRFICSQMCGHIAEWEVRLQLEGDIRQMSYTIDFQVWRPSPTVDESTGTGCYSLVGNNRFTSISLSNQVALLTPSPQDYIQFQPGDVLGFYMEEARGNNDGVVVLFNGSFPSQLVWYASIAPTVATSRSGDCPYSVGYGGVLNTKFNTPVAPVISISTVTFPCHSVVTAVGPESTDSQSLSIGLTIGVVLCVIGVIMIVIATVMIVISTALCCRVRKRSNTTFHMQRNRAYCGVNHRDAVSSDNSSSLYIYPAATNIHQNDTSDNGGEDEFKMTNAGLDVTDYQEAQSLEMNNYLDIISDRIYETCSSVEMSNGGRQSEA